MLRVLGNLFELTGFEQETIEDVRAGLRRDLSPVGVARMDVAPAPAGTRLIPPTASSVSPRCPSTRRMLIVRRSKPLQATKDAEFAGVALSPATIERLGLAVGKPAVIPRNGGLVTLDILADRRVPDDCACLPAGVPASAVLDAGDGTVVIGKSR